jgi:hypothetical protein
MQVSRVCQAIEMSSLGKAVPHYTYLWPAVESVHVAAMVVLIASITVFDMRLMGLAFRRLRVSDLGNRLLPATWGAFGVMILTGTLLFTPYAARKYCYNPSFRVKLLLILLAGINMSVFHFTIYRDVSKWDEASSTPLLAKVVGSLSVLLWASVVVAGRLIGFF